MIKKPEDITIETRKVVSFRDFFSASLVDTETIGGQLHLPRAASPLPLVVVAIGSMGVNSGREELYAQGLTAAGYAVLVVDSFTSRGIHETVSNQGQISLAQSTADVLFAAAAMRRDPRFDSRRITLLGYSRGGSAVLFAHDRRLTDAVLGPGVHFDAYVSLYPCCSLRWENPQPAAAPLLMLFGGQDMLAPPALGAAFRELLQKTGAKVSTITYPYTVHSFDSNRPVQWDPMASNFANCDIRITDEGEMIELKTGLVAGIDWGSFHDAVIERCGSQGGMTGYGGVPKERVVADVVAFLSDAA